ncbi:hypothetical protein D8890_03990 [Streptococcus sanguinis]|jgi:hypothetical protein|uniref:hypothetical protein n=1 Tax=Streptococcus sp. SN3 TaxID=3018246 RepID=UPI00069F25F9|nr:hypothetical protein [Streptococcus sp. SN3]MDN5012587.1 hypothetical protein [Streptococcus sp. SN3]RSI05897.1 hypothetical protein D8890_03990 [Streptococcus sanguinis]
MDLDGFAAIFDGKQIPNKVALFRFFEQGTYFAVTNIWPSITNWLTALSRMEADSYTFIFKDYDFFLIDDEEE